MCPHEKAEFSELEWLNQGHGNLEKVHQFLPPFEVSQPAHADVFTVFTRVRDIHLWVSEMLWKENFQNRRPCILIFPEEF